MSDLQKPQDVQNLMASLTFGAEVPAPPAAEPDDVMVVRSVRWSLGLDARLKAAAARHGVTVSQLIRDWAELELSALENDQPISRADALRALAAVRPIAS